MNNEIMTVTPDLARYFLSKSTGNRRMQKGVIENYAKQMAAGNWPVSPQGISFGKSGRLLDGHHRIRAVVKSDIPVQFVVWKDVDDSLFDVFDTGNNRTGGDVLSIIGVNNYNQIAAAITLHSRFIIGQFYNGGGKSRISNHDILEKYNDRPEFWQSVANDSQRLYRLGLHTVRPVIIAACLAYWKDKKQPTDFIEAVFTGDDIGNAKQVSRVFINAKIRKRSFSHGEITSYFFKYHNLWLAGKKAKLVSISSNEQIQTF